MLIQGNSTLSIAILAPSPKHLDKARNLACKLSVPIIRDETKEYGFLLFFSDKGLALKQTGKNNLGPILVDFTSGTMVYRLKHGGGRRQSLARAFGLNKGSRPNIIDATAGLGRDGFILAYLGCQVHLLERSPVLAVLLEDGLQRAAQSEITAGIVQQRLKITHADSRSFLQNLLPENLPEAIYLDPMYPERTKRSLVKKEMRILRNLAGNDKDAAELFTIALNCALNRVVVKRPRLAPTLTSLQPTHQINGKTSRYDVYMSGETIRETS